MSERDDRPRAAAAEAAEAAEAAADGAAAAGPRPSPARLRSLLCALGEGLIERDEAVHLALLAALAGEHVLLIGPPGTAKSALARRLHRAFDQVRYFERLLTRFSTPEELFGPLSLKALEHDRYERLTEGFLPTAGIAFLDEVFKANSAILNALLTLLNERLFDNGTERAPVPLVAVVAASNEVPGDEALHAFYDRFLVRVPVAPVGDSAFGALLALPQGEGAPSLAHPSPAAEPSPAAPPSHGSSPSPATPAPLTAAERAAVAQAAAAVELGEPFVAACTALRAWLAARKAALSDRRWRQIVGLARTAAATEGRTRLEAMDLWLAPYVASAAPGDVPALMAWFEETVLAAPPVAAPWLERAVQAFEKQLGLEQQMPAEAATGPGDDAAGKLALARALGAARRPDDGAEAAAGDGMQRIVSQRLEARLHKRWGAQHVRARVAQVGEIEAQVEAAARAVRAERDALAAATSARIWLPPVLVRRWLARHEALGAQLADLAARLRATREGFATLPIDEAQPGEAPPPMAFDATEAPRVAQSAEAAVT